MNTLLRITNMLEKAKIHFEIHKYHEDAVTIIASVPGQRWEIRIVSDEEIDVEVFKSDGLLCDENELMQMINTFKD